MRHGSRKHGNHPIKFGTESRPSEPVVSSSDLSTHLSTGKVSISLRYFQRSCECFSKWTAAELKQFSAVIEKVRGYEPAQLKAKKNLCEIHKGAPKRDRFSKPSDLAEDLRFWEIKVDQSNKLRIHGPFVGDVFFLVWMDREHDCFDG